MRIRSLSLFILLPLVGAGCVLTPAEDATDFPIQDAAVQVRDQVVDKGSGLFGTTEQSILQSLDQESETSEDVEE